MINLNPAWSTARTRQLAVLLGIELRVSDNGAVISDGIPYLHAAVRVFELQDLTGIYPDPRALDALQAARALEMPPEQWARYAYSLLVR